MQRKPCFVLLACLAAWGSAPPAAAQEAGPPFDLGDPARIETGRLRFNQTCAGYCHGGGGVGGRAPDFLGRTDLDPARAFRVIQKGSKRGSDIMPRWEQAFSPDQIWELVAYLKFLGTQSVPPAAGQ